MDYKTGRHIKHPFDLRRQDLLLWSECVNDACNAWDIPGHHERNNLTQIIVGKEWDTWVKKSAKMR